MFSPYRFLLLISGLALIFVLADSFKLKTVSYDKIPEVGVALDEYEFAWMGKGLIESGLPISWTMNLDPYKKDYRKATLHGFSLAVEGEVVNIENFRSSSKPAVAVVKHDYGKGPFYLDLVQPFFDNPPLAGLVYAMGIPKNITNLLAIKSEHFRYPLRYLSLSTAILLFALGTVWYGPLTGLLAATIYSVFPSAVFSSRLAVAENIITPFLLLSIFVLSLAKKYSKIWMYLLAGLLAGLAVLTKFSGLGVLFAGVLLCLHWKIERKYLLCFFAPTLVLLLTFALYGLYLSPELFLRVISSQAGRAGWGSIGLINNLGRVAFDGFPLDGWWAGGPLVLLYLLRQKKSLPLVIVSLSYLATIVFLGGGTYSWYFFPFAALFALGYAVLISEVFINPSKVAVSLFFIFPVLSSLYWGMVRLSPSIDFSLPLRSLFVLFIVAVWFIDKLPKLSNKWRFVWMAILVIVIVRLYVVTLRSDLYLLSQWNSLTSPLIFR